MKMLMTLALLPAAPAAAQTQAQMNARAAADYRTADAAMTAQWKRSYAYLKRLDAQGAAHSPPYAATLLDSQRAWLRFRDTQCALEGARFAGGSLQPMTRTECLTRMTRDRTTQLRAAQWR